MSQAVFRVFLSSTFGDFQAERERLRLEVWPGLRALCAERGASFHVVDLRWGISPRDSETHDTLDICLEEIRRCQLKSPRPRPNFILMLGDRYGWRPPANRIPAAEFARIVGALSGSDAEFLLSQYRKDENARPPEWCLVPMSAIADETRLVSILRTVADSLGLPAERYRYSATHREAIEGVLRPEGDKDHILAILRNRPGLPASARDGAARRFSDYLEDGKADEEAARLLAVLKSRVVETLPADRRIALDAVWSPDGSIAREYLDEVTRSVDLFLRTRLESELAVIGNMSDSDTEREQQSVFMRERSAGLAGREGELKRVRDYLELGDGKWPLIVRGPGGSGKSALMAKAAMSAADDACVRFIGASPRSWSAKNLFADLYSEIAARLGAPVPPFPEHESLQELTGAFWGLFESRGEGEPFALFIDALDQLADTKPSEYGTFLPREPPPNLRFVVSVAVGPGSERLSELYPEAPVIDLAPLAAPDRERVLDASLAGRSLTGEQREAFLRAASVGGLPLWLSLAAPVARHLHSWDAPPDLPADLTDLAAFVLDGMASRHGPVFTNRALRYVRLARFGLSEAEVQDLLWQDPEVRAEFEATRNKDQPDVDSLPPVLWSRLYAELEPYLSERLMDGQPLLTYFHRIVGDAADRMDDAERRALHGRLANWFGAQPLYRGGRPNGRRLMEEPYHLTLAGRIEEARARITDFDYAMAKCALNRSDDWVDDFRRASGDRPGTVFTRWERFVNGFAHILRRGDDGWPAHKILLQLAVEHADDSPATEAAERWLEAGNCDWVWLRRTLRPARARGDECVVLEGHRGEVRGARELPDGSIQSWSWDETRRWSPEGTMLEAVPIPDDWTEPALECRGAVSGALRRADGSSVSWSPSEICLRDPTGAQERVIAAHTDTVVGAALREDGSFVTWSYDTTVRLWSRHGEQLRVFRGHGKDIQGASILRDGRIMSWSNDATVRIWNPEAESPETLPGHARWVTGVLTRDDGGFVTRSDDGTLRLWDPEGAQLATMEGHASNVIGFVEGPNGRILSWSYDDTLRLWDRSGTALAVLAGHSGRINGALFRSDGSILSWSEDETLRLWDASGELSWIARGHRGSVLGAIVRPDRSILSWGADDSLRLWTNEGSPVAAVSALEELKLDDGASLVAFPDATVRRREADGSFSCPVPLDEAFELHPSWNFFGNDIEFALPLPDGSFLSAVAGETVRRWSPSCDPLGAFPREEARTSFPELAAYERRLSRTVNPFESGTCVSLQPCEDAAEGRDIRWQSASICDYVKSFPDGRTIVTRLDGQVCVLRRYRGNRRLP